MNKCFDISRTSLEVDVEVALVLASRVDKFCKERFVDVEGVMLQRA